MADAEASDGETMKDMWSYSDVLIPTPYGADALTYMRAMEFLADCESVEDWGCGTAYAKQFCKGRSYVGIDGSRSRFADIVADLRDYRSEVDGILMRHVLEHNREWKAVLNNALASFRRRLALVLFTPFQEATGVLGVGSTGIPDIAFRKQDLTDCFEGLLWQEESLVTRTYYGREHLFYLRR